MRQYQIYVHPNWSLVDEIDWLWLVPYEWNLHKGYAQAWVNGEPKAMHKLIAQRMGIVGDVDPESRHYVALGYIAFLRKHQVSFFLEWL